MLFRYRAPTKRALTEITNREIYAARPSELNDPFECSAPVWWNVNLMRRRFVEEYAPKHGLSAEEAEKVFESSSNNGIQQMLSGLKHIAAQTGIICFSSKPNSIRMWSYYANCHQGICIGYDTKIRPFNLAIAVNYENPNKPFDIFASIQNDPTEIANHIALRKAEEWKFEDEYRIPVGIGGNPRLIPIDPQAIREIRFGACIKSDFKIEVLGAISKLSHRPKLIQMGCDFDRFILTESVV